MTPIMSAAAASTITTTTATSTGTAATTPLRRLATHATSTCATQASAYGKCILKSYTDMRRDACQEEFELFGKCLRESVSWGVLRLLFGYFWFGFFVFFCTPASTPQTLLPQLVVCSRFRGPFLCISFLCSRSFFVFFPCFLWEFLSLS